MDDNFIELLIKLNECAKLAGQAAKNVLYMEMSFVSDNTQTEYLNKLQRMNNEVPYLIRRVNDLLQVLEEFNRIAMT